MLSEVAIAGTMANILSGCPANDNHGDTRLEGGSMLTAILALCAFAIATMPAIAEEDLIAIDVLLIPDEKMMEVSAAWNAKMREQTPEGFELDETHQPHITLIQRHIAKKDLDAVLKAVAELRKKYGVEDLSMTANGLYHIPTGDEGLAGITIELSQQLRDLQAAVIGAVNQFDAGAGDQSAYVAVGNRFGAQMA